MKSNNSSPNRPVEEAEHSSHLIHSSDLRAANQGHSYASAPSSTNGLKGKLRGWLLKFLLGDYFEKELQQHASIVRYLNFLTSHVDVELGDKLKAFQSEIGHSLKKQALDLETLSSKDFPRLSDGLEHKLKILEQANRENQIKLEAQDAVLKGLESIIRVEGKVVAPPNVVKADSVGCSVDYDYFLFENRYRGSEETIKERQAGYVELFKSSSKKILEIGAGRGELLELFSEAKIDSYGVDVDQGMVKYATSKGLEVSCEDACQHLENLKDDSLSGIIAVQVIEHLPLEYFRSLLRQAHRVLEPGGRLVFETINPCSIVALTQHYFRDPTHVSPLHPDTTSYLMESAGFVSIESTDINPFPEEAKLGMIDGIVSDEPGLLRTLEKLNIRINRLDDLLYGHQDYFISGQVPKPSK